MEKLSFCLRLFEKWYDCLQKFQHVAQGQDQAQLNADKEDEKKQKKRHRCITMAHRALRCHILQSSGGAKACICLARHATTPS
jgi:hypothetical protein